MKWQFQRETRNRQEKARKSDYQEDFAYPFHPGGSQGLTITLADIVRGTAAKKLAREMRIAAARFIESTLRGATHQVGGCQFRFKMTREEFASANRLSAKEAARRFEEIAEEAQQRLAMTKTSALKAEFEVEIVERSEDTIKTMLQITFKNFLHPVKPIPWEQIYKRIRLNAINIP